MGSQSAVEFSPVELVGLQILVGLHPIDRFAQFLQIANGVTEAAGNGAGFYGKPYQPGAIIKNDVEYILFLRKGGSYRSPSPVQRALSMLTREEMQNWTRSSWVARKARA